MKEKIVGAVWVHIINDYGHIDDETPSLAISLYEEYRNLGLGTALMKEMRRFLKNKGYKQVSLSVQKENYAVGMYRKLGFKAVSENDEEYIMVCQLQHDRKRWNMHTLQKQMFPGMDPDLVSG